MSTASAARAAVTPFESMLLHAASALDLFVAARLERRGGPAYRRAAETWTTGLGARGAAEARGAIGMLPR